MPKHPDAVGYLNDLAIFVDEPWFKMICDLTTVSGVSKMDTLTLDAVFAIYDNRASYLGVRAIAGVPAIVPAANSTQFLEKLSGFTNFKLLGGELEVHFKKRITLIFGANGSGKSSLCESLKVLAEPEAPLRPIYNVRSGGPGLTAFNYKFKSDLAPTEWRPSAGYGPKRSIVKYFDTAIAIKNVKLAVEPGRVIVITPFKLYVFEWTKTLTAQFRESIQTKQHSNELQLTQKLECIRANFAKFANHPLSMIDISTVAILPAQILIGESFLDPKLLCEKLELVVNFEKAASEDGLKMLRVEYRELQAFASAIDEMITAVATLWELDAPIKIKALADKKAEQQTLSKALIPKDGKLETLIGLLKATKSLCSFDQVEDHCCPLCKRELRAQEIQLFRTYHDLLTGELETEIADLKLDVAKASKLVEYVTKLDLSIWDSYPTIPTKHLEDAKAFAETVVSNCNESMAPSDEARSAYESLRNLSQILTEQLLSKKNAGDAANNGRTEFLKQLAMLRSQIEPLEYAKTISDHLKELQEARNLVLRAEFFSTKLPTFIQLLKKITAKAKQAHEELVVADFESRLNDEYKALTERNMAAFGVALARKGSDAAVTVVSQIGGKDIETILSEGEQRVHALALFFAELETCTHSVLVFDDPISSFDYNYIANYCARLRDFSVKHPNRQIILLTHNWEFFIQVQTTLNKASLESHLSIQVLENRSVVSDYSEKIDELKRDIDVVLRAPSEPTKSQKEDTAGKIRRLIEVVVNTHVFNKERHQYKQKSQAISAFHNFTKIVALLPDEATILRDLYEKLSITEHDDPRNAYVNTDKAMFQSRYDKVIAVETSVLSRRP